MDHLFIDVAHLGLGQNLRLELSGVSRRDHIHPVIAVHVHEAQGAEAVEPNIGHPLNDLFLAVALDGLFELLDGLGAFPAGGAVFSQHQFQLGGDLLQQSAPGELGEFF
ncbi:MAG: hypothetical protein PHO72_11010 [Sphaerochaeta sp.]|nr:hypothetical protein [Sphaerochaeta sp.]